MWGVTKVFQSEVKNWRKKFHHHVQLINLLHDMVVTGFFLVIEMISLWQDIHDICPWVWECKPVLVDGSGISLQRHSWYVHKYWSANQCWSVMTKASKPGEVQVIQPHSRSKNLQLWAKDATWMKVTCRLLNFWTFVIRLFASAWTNHNLFINMTQTWSITKNMIWF
jgi:hypothetical protein